MNKGSTVKHWFLWYAVVFLYFSPLVSICNAGKASTSLGSRYVIYGFPDDEEKTLGYNIAQFIASLATLRKWDQAENWYGASTTVSNIYYASAALLENYGIAWYTGHGGWQYRLNWIFYEQQWAIRDDRGVLVWDDDIYEHTYPPPPHRTNFTMLWACHSADVIGGSHWSGTPYGMPCAWLRTGELSSDGYANPWCSPPGSVFIGWTPNAPGLSMDDVGGGPDNTGYNFALQFYSKAFYGNSINNALDYASQVLWGVSFADSIFSKGWYPYPGDFDQMKVYGDGGHTLPYTG